MKIRTLVLLFLSILPLARGQAAPTNAVDAVREAETNAVVKVKATGNRVSLRAKPSLNAEILDRAMQGEEFVSLGETNGWRAIQAPETLSFWVARQYVVDGVVQPARLNVRSGPGPSYSVVDIVDKGDKLAVRGEFNGWVKIAPPAGCKVWISAEYSQIVEPPKPKEETPEKDPQEATVVEGAKTNATAVVKEVPAPKKEELKPLLLVLDKSREQGTYDEIPGILRRANPGLYKLVVIDGDTEKTVCLVRGEQHQMESLLGRSMLIKGRKYWAKGVEWPVIQPDKIHLDPIVSE